MKKPILLLSLSILFACSPPAKEEKDHSEAIQAIETRLLAGVLVEGEEPEYSDIESRMAHHKVPGLSIAFFEEGKIQWTRSYGYADKEGQKPVDAQTLFQAASISKPVAATGTMTLVESGVFDLDTDVNSYLANWKVPENGFTTNEKVTLRRLVTHNAGLTVHGFRGYASDEDVPTTTQVLDGETPANSDAIFPDTFPGAIQRYSGGGYTVMQKMLEDHTGGNIADFLQETVLSKTGMTQSTYQQPLPEKFHAHAAYGYRYGDEGEKVKGNWHTYPEQAAAGLWTTPSDLAHFAISLQNAYHGSTDEFVSPEMAKQIISEQVDGQGLGPFLDIHGDTLWFGHGGANEGFRCILKANAQMLNGQGVAIMTNSDNGSALANEILRSMSAYYHWDISKPVVRKAIPMEASQFQQFAGLYEYEEDYQVRITDIGDGHLEAKNLWNDWVYQMRPESEMTFFTTNYGNRLEYKTDSDGKITGFQDGRNFARRVEMVE